MNVYWFCSCDSGDNTDIHIDYLYRWTLSYQSLKSPVLNAFKMSSMYLSVYAALQCSQRGTATHDICQTASIRTS